MKETKDQTEPNTINEIVDNQELTQKNEALTAENEYLKAKIESLENQVDTLKKDNEILKKNVATSYENTVSEPDKGLDFKFRDNHYKFVDEAPKKILFNGESYSQEEIITDEEILLYLIANNSNLIEKSHGDSE